MRYRAAGRLAIGLLAFLAQAGCSDNLFSTQSFGSPTGNSPGAPVEMGARLDTVSRLVALGLRERETRTATLRAMRASVFPEHKLVLQDFIGTIEGGRLLRAGAEAMNVQSNRALAMVASLPRLDFYVMRNEDRETWTGTPNVAVFGTLTSVRASPVGFTSLGERVRLSSRGQRLVAFALHPEEPKYERMDLKPFSEGSVIQERGELQMGAMFTLKSKDMSQRSYRVKSFAELKDSRELLARLRRTDRIAAYGQPGQIVAPDVVTAYACDHGCFFGPENIELQFRSSIDGQGEIWFSFDMPWVQFRTRQFQWPAIVLRNDVPGSTEHLLWQLWEMDGTTFDDNDLWIDRDYLGGAFTNAVQRGGSPRCSTGDGRFICTPEIIWREVNTFLARVTTQGEVANDGLNSSEAYGYITTYVPPPPPFQVSITGTPEIAPYAGCSWFAQVTSGNPPYSYSWTVNGQPIGTESEVWYWNDGNPFTLEVTVSDANGNWAIDDHYVSIDENAGCY